ncbi:MAG TPA: phosphate signaling complex protein PhoU [Planctomycetota bacterium]|nr:phosphate signaling complex protein PhoU [Planctomycetota bacterium]
MRHFDEQIQDLQQRLVLMGRLAESMIQGVLRMLIERNSTLFEEVERKEDQVNELQIEVDDRALKLAALQQPVANDVRLVFMASRIATELERIADQAINIGQNAKHLLTAPPLKPFVDIPIMAKICQEMVANGLAAFVNRNVDLAQEVLKEEEKVDAFRDQIFRELLTYMMADPATIPRAMSLILISRNLERVGDHATNIAEEVIYLVQGRDVRHRHETQTRSQPAPKAGPRDSGR